jgi:hypothetical protein
MVVHEIGDSAEGSKEKPRFGQQEEQAITVIGYL